MPADASPTYFGKPRSVTIAELKPEEEVKCPLCHLPPKPFAVDYQGFQLCRCQTCGLEFLSPRLGFEQLSEKVYSPAYFLRQGEEQQPGPAEREQFSQQLINYERLLGRRGKILDVGCGNGWFLQYAETVGWEVCGTDIVLSRAAAQLECKLWEGRMQDIDFEGELFDVVRFNQVLEHTDNPLSTLVLARQRLKQGGLVHISVPNIAGVSPRLKSLQSRLRLKRHRWRHYAALHHLFFFSPQTLRLVVERAGLQVITWETPVPKKVEQHRLVESFYRRILQQFRLASILDFYCSAQITDF